jgi:hypothetical protein
LLRSNVLIVRSFGPCRTQPERIREQTSLQLEHVKLRIAAIVADTWRPAPITSSALAAKTFSSRSLAV